MPRKPGSGQPKSLGEGQIALIIKLRRNGKQYKEIAKEVNCTPDQAIHYWKTSKFFRPEKNRSLAAKRRQANLRQLAAAREASREKKQQKLGQLVKLAARRAAEELKHEIACAVQEAATAPLFKQSDLRW